MAKVLDEAGVPPLPEDTGPRVRKAAGLNVDAEGPGQMEVTLSHPGVRMVVNALGPPPKYVLDQAHDAGLLVGALVGAKQHAERQVALGVDVLVAQGTEAGGHCGEISTMVLVPEVVDAVGPDVPVLAAGGIADGRQMAAAMALGAQGVWTGSIWLLTQEADLSPEATENLLAAELARLRPHAGDDRQARAPAAHQVAGGVGARRRARPAAHAAPGPAVRRGRASAGAACTRRTSPAAPPARCSAAVDRVRPAKDVVLDDGRAVDRHHRAAQLAHGGQVTIGDRWRG